MAFARSSVGRVIKVSAIGASLWLGAVALERPAAAAGGESRVRLKWDWRAAATDRAGRHVRVPMVRDWADRQVLAPEVVPARLASKITASSRFWQQYLRRHAGRLARYDRDRDGVPNPNADLAVARDWSFSLNNGSGGTIGYPAKYVFDVNAAPSCTNDFVVTGVNVAGSATQANLIGLNSLYNMPAGNGLCAGTAPTVMFAYNIGPGVINSYIQLSLDGTKVAFNENGTNSYFHILRWRSGTGNGTSASAAVTPGTGNTAVDTKILLSAGTSTAPYVDYDTDVAYVTTNDNVVHKIRNVFLGTPAEVTTGGWPVATGLGGTTASISTPVYDPVSKHVFFTDSDNGGLNYIDDSVVPAVAVTNKFYFAPGLTVAAPVLVDLVNQKVYAFSSNGGGSNSVVSQADTNLSAASQVTVNVGLSATTYSPLMGDFTEDYWDGDPTSALLYVAGNNGTANRLPALYAIGFNASYKMNATLSNGPLALTTNTSGISASPVTAFYNSTLNKQFLFVAVSNRCTAAITGGCIRSIDVTSGFPTATSINNVVLAAAGGTGGISIDNVSSATGASSVYFTTLTGRTLVKATQAALQ